MGWTHDEIHEYYIGQITKTLTDITSKDYCQELEELFIGDDEEENKMQKKHPLNQILYGPPGTGKTYNTVVECIHILDRDLYNQYLDSGNKVEFYETKLFPMYNKYRDDGRIEFITFHQ